MFKKGQVLRHRLTGSAVLVIEWPRVRRLTKPTIGRAPVGQEYCVSKHLEHYFNLIGNNYRARTKIETIPPLAPFPPQPGAAFRRWLADQTSGRPEQRGCRKEDC